MQDPLLESKYAFRSEMVDRLVEDLYGPSSVDEVLTERPLERYVTGVLWPAESQTQDDSPDEPSSETEEPGDSAADSPVASTRMTYPSSLGLTVSVDLSIATSIRVVPTGACYVPSLPPGNTSVSPKPEIPVVEHRSSTRTSRSVDYHWTRMPLAPNAIHIDLTVDPGHYSYNLHDGDLEVYALVREPNDGIATVTIALRNRRTQVEGKDRDVACWFQVGLTVETDTYAFADRAKYRTEVSADQDLASAELLYRRAYVFGAGHGCAVTWDVDDVDAYGSRCAKVTTTFVPRAEVHRSKPGSTTANISLKFLGHGVQDEVILELEKMVAEYKDWILGIRSAADSGHDSNIPPHLTQTAIGHMDAADDASERILNGINLLKADRDAFSAFQHANRAMHMQRSRQDWIRNGANGEFFLGDAQSWRPFQIAFILLNLPSVTDPGHPERDVADLLWFPTGGGKTEAYLGLIAYVILLRRLRDPDAKGVAVIMRYTLRLLTIQQFERAAMLICSLETIRHQSPEMFGSEAFGIGLWVGAAATPNNIKEARTNLGKLRAGDSIVEGNPCQVEACPWCGARILVDNYQIRSKPFESLAVTCPNTECDFHAGLPIHIIDDDVYRVRPELVIGTVDKFARMAWNGNVANIFGRIQANDYGPDLIIQDELHLISGPLGSTVGLFESAVDLAAGDSGRIGTAQRISRKPKIVASTATIRRSDDQIRAVFDRSAKLFPPPGIDPDKSFFAEASTRDELGTREYVGLMASGTSHATLMIRVYASLLNSAAVIDASSHEDRDPYWTLIGYFNSLRVLGSAYLQVYDDVRTRLRLLAKRDGLDTPRKIELSELTSRVSSDKVPFALKSLENSLGSELKPNDVVLATNMISVGLDVDRLGLMAVMGQPQSSAEYIQATSRVGRKHPGLVLTILNAAKSRDRSHFEGFIQFHNALYRSVEATSATPFAARSRDRALHAVMVSAIRMIENTARADNQATSITTIGTAVQTVIDHVRKRVDSIAPNEAHATVVELESLLKTWRLEATNNAALKYAAPRDSKNSLLIDYAKALEDKDYVPTLTVTPWPTPNSMRDVDAETTLRPRAVRDDANNG
ncbi:helicase-related protein [Arthrobacter alpinus]|uniref:helicase-related protein n=1 Tax=Arthrobacter alpinus TaxID=656366 RepID=UPI001C93F858|nr:helicase-related protein [Arthrobacter alpinus]